MAIMPLANTESRKLLSCLIVMLNPVQHPSRIETALAGKNGA